MGNVINVNSDEIFSMARLIPKRSGLDVPLYIDDVGSYKQSGHWKRIKFKHDNDVGDNPRNWMPMDLDGNLRENWKVKVSTKEIKNFVHNNKYILELIADQKIDFGDFLDIVIKGGDVATESQINEQKIEADKRISEDNVIKSE